MTRAAALLLIALFAGLRPVAAGAQARPGVLLDVPYLTQTPQLCGGAALAMVLRFWGDRNVFAEDFADLVDDEERGIRTSVLRDAASRHGLDVMAAPGGSAGLEALADHIQQGRPVIALVAVGPRRYHYVVVTAITDGAVVYHDPARAPFIVTPRRAFDAAWAAGGRWMLVAVRRAPAVDSASADAVRPAASPCSALIAASVSLARSGDLEAGSRGLEAATTLCPADPAPWIELAGVRVLERRFAEAEVLARQAIARDPDSALAWRIVGTTSFVSGNASAALAAWNHLGEPTTDVVAVEGATRTPHPVIVAATGLTPRALLTPEALARAARRLDELPIAQRATLRVDPMTGGTAGVTAQIVERAPYPAGAAGWGSVGLNTAFLREIRIGLYGLAGQGEGVDLGWRFRHNRPRVRAEVSAPAPGPLPGVLAVESAWERQAYAIPGADAPALLHEERRRTAVRWSDWASGAVRWRIGAALDRFDARRFGAFSAEIDVRLVSDHVALRAAATRWAGGGAGGFSAHDVVAAWRSHADEVGWGWEARSGWSLATAGAPLAVWPLASSSTSRGALLRGHALYSDGAITTRVFGRRLAHGTLEYRHPVWQDAFGAVGVAGFVDVGRAWLGDPARTTSDWQVDIGAGLRLQVPSLTGQVRLDAGYATRTGRANLSAGYVVPWGS